MENRGTQYFAPLMHVKCAQFNVDFRAFENASLVLVQTVTNLLYYCLVHLGSRCSDAAVHEHSCCADRLLNF